VRALGGRGKHIQICLCLAQSAFFEPPPTPSKPPSERAQRRSSQRERSERAVRRRLCVFADVRVTTKRGYWSASVAVRVEKRANKNVKIRLLFSETETAKQNQKFPFHFFFRFAAEGWGEEAREKCKEIFWFLHTRVRERVRGAFSLSQDLTRNTFELRPIHTAKSC
jgi:hypothetical protein